MTIYLLSHNIEAQQDRSSHEHSIFDKGSQLVLRRGCAS
jgi:hypothetical protein